MKPFTPISREEGWRVGTLCGPKEGGRRVAPLKCEKPFLVTNGIIIILVH